MGNVITDIQDLTYLEWSKVRKSSGTAGSFLKAVTGTGKDKRYYKLSDFDSVNGITGHECVNEIIADRLLDLLGVEHLSYDLIHAEIRIQDKTYLTWLCASDDYKHPAEAKTAFDIYFEADRTRGESVMEYCIRKGWDDYLYRMFTVDFLILNRDRHGANLEVLTDRKTQQVRLSPLFDHGLSFVFSCHDLDALERFDVTGDYPVQCFAASHSARSNLDLIPNEQFPVFNELKADDYEYMFADLQEALDQPWLDKIREMIRQRWSIYEDLRNQKLSG